MRRNDEIKALNKADIDESEKAVSGLSKHLLSLEAAQYEGEIGRLSEVLQDLREQCREMNATLDLQRNKLQQIINGDKLPASAIEQQAKALSTNADSLLYAATQLKAQQVESEDDNAGGIDYWHCLFNFSFVEKSNRLAGERSSFLCAQVN
jgi:hypothetical protein